MIPVALIVSPVGTEADPIHATRLFNLVEFLSSIGWHGEVFDDDSAPAIDRLILIEREGHDAESIRGDRLVHPRYGMRSGFAEVLLDWTDIDGFDESTDAARWSDPAGVGEDRTALGARITATAAIASVQEVPAATTMAVRPLIAFAGDREPRDPADTVAFPDGTFLATLDDVGLSFRRQDGERPRPSTPPWAGADGIPAPRRLLAATRELGHVTQLMISSPAGTFSVRSPDQKEWLRPERIGATAAAGAFAGDAPVMIGDDGRLAGTTHGVTDAGSLPEVIAGVDAVTRGATVWLLAWGTDRLGESVAVVQRSGKGDAVVVARLDDIVRGGLERHPNGDPAIWAIGRSGTIRRVEGGKA